MFARYFELLKKELCLWCLGVFILFASLRLFCYLFVLLVSSTNVLTPDRLTFYVRVITRSEKWLDPVLTGFSHLMLPLDLNR